MLTPHKYQLMMKVKPDLVCGPYLMFPGLGARAGGSGLGKFLSPLAGFCKELFCPTSP